MANAILSLKICSFCKLAQQPSEYHAHQTTKDRLYPVCKTCRRGTEQQPAYRSDAQNAASRRADKKAYYDANRAQIIGRALKWAKDNPARMAARAMERIAIQRRASPLWANAKAIAEIYEEAGRRTESTGIAWHVDHVIPLKSKYVCGLHVENNLSLLTAVENIAKGNSYWPDMP